MRPELLTSITDALQQISALTAEKEDLTECLNRERITFGKIIYDLTTQLEAKKDECNKLNRYLHQAHEIMLDREHQINELQERIKDLEQANAEMKEQVAKSMKKEWQLQELCEMLSGKRSERFIPESETVDKNQCPPYGATNTTLQNMHSDIKLLITDLDNTLYDWVTFFAQSFYSMLDELSSQLKIDKEILIREFKEIHQSYENTEQPFAVTSHQSSITIENCILKAFCQRFGSRIFRLEKTRLPPGYKTPPLGGSSGQ